MLTEKEIILAVANEIQNMMYNDITCENGVESFECWCNDGEVFEAYDCYTKEDVEQIMDKVRALAPVVDQLVLSNLNIDHPECNKKGQYKAFVAFGDAASHRASSGEWKELAELWKENPQSIGVREFDTYEERYAYFLGLNEAIGWGDYYGLEDIEVARLGEEIDLSKIDKPCEI